MTVSNTTSRKSFAGNDLTVAFDTSPVVFFDAADLQVYVIVDATGVATLKTITTHYTVSGGDGTTGTVTMLTAPATGETLLIVRSLAITQGSDFVNNDGSDAEVAEDALDRLTMIAQELDTEVGRSFKLATSDVSGASTEIPAPDGSKIIGWNSAGTALQNYSPADIDASLVSDFMETVLDDETAAEARTTLDVPSNAEAVLDTLVTTKGDIIVATAASTPARKAVGTDGYALQAQPGAADGLQYMPPQAGFALQNGYLDWSVAGNVLTVAIKTFAGTDPSATDPVYITFRSATAGTGSLVVRKLTAATSIAVPNTATLGTTNSVAFRIWAVAFDDGGTVRLGIINARNGTDIWALAGWGIPGSSDLIGTGSDSAHNFYSSAATTAKPYATLGYADWVTGLATAGTWSAAPTKAQLFGPGTPLPGHVIQLKRSATGAVATGTTVLPEDDTIPQITEGDEYLSLAIAPTSGVNVLRCRAQVSLANSGTAPFGLTAALFRDAVADALAATISVASAANFKMPLSLDHARIAADTGAAQTFRVRGGGSVAGTTTFNGASGNRQFGGVMNSYIEVQEIMA